MRSNWRGTKVTLVKTQKKRGTPSPERPRLQEAWARQFATAPPAFLSVSFMKSALEFERQCKKHGRPKASLRRQLEQIAIGRPLAEIGPTKATTGAHLVRDWDGRTYQVKVVNDGYVMDGKKWRSLSAIAKHITGTNWSGPRFFGLTKVGAA